MDVHVDEPRRHDKPRRQLDRSHVSQRQVLADGGNATALYSNIEVTIPSGGRIDQPNVAQ